MIRLRSQPSELAQHCGTHPRGFSLIELLIVISIMAVLASVGLPLAELSHQRAKEEELRRSLRDLRGALDDHKRLVDREIGRAHV